MVISLFLDFRFLLDFLFLLLWLLIDFSRLLFEVDGLVDNKNISWFAWDLLENFLLLFFFLFYILWLFIRLIIFFLVFFLVFLWSSSWFTSSVALDLPLDLLALLSSSLAWVWISEIEITIEFVTAWAAGLVLGLMFVLVLPLQITPKVDVVLFPELIFINLSPHQVFHFGPPFGPKAYSFNGCFVWGTLLWLLLVDLLGR